MRARTVRQKAHHFGQLAESIAAWYLRCKGYRIVAQRYRNVWGEIDLVAVRGRTLVAVEVKARHTMGECHDTITCHKQQKVTAAMQGLLSGRSKITGLVDVSERNIRFDVIWIAPWCWPRHVVDAWRL